MQRKRLKLMSKRSNWCEFDKNTRKLIYERDKKHCIYCGGRFGLAIAHIFVNRSHGGKGCKENGVLLCTKCHNDLDNGNNAKKRQDINQYCMNYLYNLYKDIDRKSLIYDKWRGIYEI